MANVMGGDDFLAALNGVVGMDMSSGNDDSILDMLNGGGVNADVEQNVSAQSPTPAPRELGFYERHGLTAQTDTGFSPSDAYDSEEAGQVADFLYNATPFTRQVSRANEGSVRDALTEVAKTGKVPFNDINSIGFGGISFSKGELGKADKEWLDTEGKKFDLYARAEKGEKGVDYSPIYARAFNAKTGRYQVEKDENGVEYLDDRYAGGAEAKELARAVYMKQFATEWLRQTEDGKDLAKRELSSDTAPWYTRLGEGATESLGFAAELYMGGAAMRGLAGTGALGEMAARLAQIGQAGKAGLLGWKGKTALAGLEIALPSIENAVARFEQLTADDVKFDEDGNISFVEGDGLMRGAVKAGIGAIAENAVEVALGKVVNRMLGGTARWLGGTKPMRKLLGKLPDGMVSKTRDLWFDTMKKYAKVQNTLKFDLPTGEFAEEYVQGALDEVVGLDVKAAYEDTKLSDFNRQFFSWDAGLKDLTFGILGQTLLFGAGAHVAERGRINALSFDRRVTGALKERGFSSWEQFMMGANKRLATGVLANTQREYGADGNYELRNALLQDKTFGATARDVLKVCGIGEKRMDAMSDREVIAALDVVNAVLTNPDGAEGVLKEMNGGMQKILRNMEMKSVLDGNWKNVKGANERESRATWAGASDENGNINWVDDGENGAYVEDGATGARVYKKPMQASNGTLSYGYVAFHPELGYAQPAPTIRDALNWVSDMDKAVQERADLRKQKKEYVGNFVNRIVQKRTDKKTGETFGANVITVNNADDAAQSDNVPEQDRADMANLTDEEKLNQAYTSDKTGIVYVFADNVKSVDQMMYTVIHELGGHVAPRAEADAMADKENAKREKKGSPDKVSGGSLLDAIIAKVYPNSKSKDENKAEMERKARKDSPNAEKIAQEEGLAYGNEMYAPNASMFQRAKTAVKMFVNEKFGKDIQLTDDDYNAIATAGLDKIKQTVGVVGDMAETTYSYGSDTPSAPLAFNLNDTKQGLSLEQKEMESRWVSDFARQQDALAAARLQNGAAQDKAEADARNAEVQAKEDAKIAKMVQEQDEQDAAMADAALATPANRTGVADVLNDWNADDPATNSRVVNEATKEEIDLVLDAVDAEMGGSDGALKSALDAVMADIKKRKASADAKARLAKFGNPQTKAKAERDASEKKLVTKFAEGVQMNHNSMLAFWLSNGKRLLAQPTTTLERMQGTMVGKKGAKKPKMMGQRVRFSSANGLDAEALNQFFDGLKDKEREKWMRIIFGEDYAKASLDGSRGNANTGADMRNQEWIAFKTGADINDNARMMADDDYNDFLGMLNQLKDEYEQYEAWKAGDQLTAEEQADRDAIAEYEAYANAQAAAKDEYDAWRWKRDGNNVIMADGTAYTVEDDGEGGYFATDKDNGETIHIPKAGAYEEALDGQDTTVGAGAARGTDTADTRRRVGERNADAAAGQDGADGKAAEAPSADTEDALNLDKNAIEQANSVSFYDAGKALEQDAYAMYRSGLKFLEDRDGWTPQEKAQAKIERVNWKKLVEDAYNDMLRRRGNWVSPMVAGPAKYNQKKWDRRYDAMVGAGSEWQEKMKRFIENAPKRIADSAPAEVQIQRIREGGLKHGEAIKADDENAVEKIQAKLDNLRAEQDKMKAQNAWWRKNGTMRGFDGIQEDRVEALDKAIRESFGGVPAPKYALSNNAANIRRLEQRLEEMKRNAEKAQAVGPQEHPWGTVIENVDENRLQIDFGGEKPSEEVRDLLKRNGFKWSPRNEVWQRQLTDNARYAMERITPEIDKLFDVEDLALTAATPQEIAAEDTDLVQQAIEADQMFKRIVGDKTIPHDLAYRIADAQSRLNDADKEYKRAYDAEHANGKKDRSLTPARISAHERQGKIFNELSELKRQVIKTIRSNDGELKLESATSQQLAAEQQRNRERAEVRRRLDAPLKTGTGEVGQSLMDLGGAEGEDLFNRTEEAPKFRRSFRVKGSTENGLFDEIVKADDKTEARREIFKFLGRKYYRGIGTDIDDIIPLDDTETGQSGGTAFPGVRSAGDHAADTAQSGAGGGRTADAPARNGGGVLGTRREIAKSGLAYGYNFDDALANSILEGRSDPNKDEPYFRTLLWRRAYTPNAEAQKLADIRIASVTDALRSAKIAQSGVSDLLNAERLARELAMQGSIAPELRDIIAATRTGSATDVAKANARAVFSRPNLSRVIEVMQDTLVPMKELERRIGITKDASVYYQFDRNYGLVAKAMDDLQRDIVEPLAKELKDNKIGQDDFRLLLMALHGAERNRMIAERSPYVLTALNDPRTAPLVQGILNGTNGSVKINDADIFNISQILGWVDKNGIRSKESRQFERDLAGSGATTAWWNERLDEYSRSGLAQKAQKAVDLVRELTRRNRQLLVDTGRLSAAQAALWEKLSPNYVPLRSDMEMDANVWGKWLMGGGAEKGGGSGKRYVDGEYNHAYGRGTLADNPLEFAIQQYEESLNRAYDNVARRRLADLVRQDRNLGTVFRYEPRMTASKRAHYAKAIAIIRNKIAAGTATADDLKKLNWYQEAFNADTNIPLTRVLGQNGVYHEMPTISALEGTKKAPTQIIAFKEDGNLKFIKLGGFDQADVEADPNKLDDVAAKRIATAVKKQNMAEIGGFLKFMRTATGLFSALRTAYSPTFLVSNFGADNTQASRNLYATFGGRGALQFEKYAFHALKAAKAVIGNNFDNTKIQQYAKEWYENGGKIGGLATENIKDLRKGVEQMLRRLNSQKQQLANVQSFGDVLNWIKDKGADFADFAEKWNSVVEMSTRIAAYATCRDMGYSVADAVSYSRDITVNFNRKGTATPVINALYAFSNATMQDIARSLEAFAEGDKIGGAAIIGKRGAKMGFGLMLMGFLASMFGFWQDDEKDEKEGKAQWKYAKEWQKQNTLGFRIGEKVYGVPIRGLSRIPFYLGHQVYEMMTGRKNVVKAAGDTLGLAAENAFDFLGQSSSVPMSAVPSALRPVGDMMVNKTFTGRQMYRDPLPGQEETAVRSEMGRKGTSDAAKHVARLLNRMTGGDEKKRGLVDVQPEIVAETWNWLFGSAGKDIANIVSTGVDIATGNIGNRDLRNIPYLSRFARKLDENSADYYKARGRYEQAKAHYNGMADLGKTEAMAEDVAENPWLSSRGSGKRWGEELKDLDGAVKKLLEIEKGASPEDYDAIHQLRLKTQYQFMRRLESPPTDDAEGVQAEREHRRAVAPLLKSSKREQKRERREEKKRKRLF